MTFICPVVADAAAGQHVVHLGLTGFILVTGSVLLARGYAVFRATAPGVPADVATRSQSAAGGFSPSRQPVAATEIRSVSTAGR